MSAQEQLRAAGSEAQPSSALGRWRLLLSQLVDYLLENVAPRMESAALVDDYSNATGSFTSLTGFSFEVLRPRQFIVASVSFSVDADASAQFQIRIDGTTRARGSSFCLLGERQSVTLQTVLALTPGTYSIEVFGRCLGAGPTLQVRPATQANSESALISLVEGLTP